MNILDIVRETVYETLEDFLLDAVTKAVAAEREACAAVVEDHACQHGTTCIGSWDIAAEIRARPR